VRIITDIPDPYRGRGIVPLQAARNFAIELVHAEPWGGGLIEGRIVKRPHRDDARDITISLRCAAAWLDASPASVIQRRRLPVWFDVEVGETSVTVSGLCDANWRRFALEVPAATPRAVEATFTAIRYELIARRHRRIGRSATASCPILVIDDRTEPILRTETTPLGDWRLLEWRAPEERPFAAGPIRIDFEERCRSDLPLPGETREREIRRRTGRNAHPA